MVICFYIFPFLSHRVLVSMLKFHWLFKEMGYRLKKKQNSTALPLRIWINYASPRNLAVEPTPWGAVSIAMDTTLVTMVVLRLKKVAVALQWFEETFPTMHSDFTPSSQAAAKIKKEQERTQSSKGYGHSIASKWGTCQTSFAPSDKLNSYIKCI